MLVKLVLAPKKEVAVLTVIGGVADSVAEEDREDTKPANHHLCLLRGVYLINDVTVKR
jgi:hypothetical protein